MNLNPIAGCRRLYLETRLVKSNPRKVVDLARIKLFAYAPNDWDAAREISQDLTYAAEALNQSTNASTFWRLRENNLTSYRLIITALLAGKAKLGMPV